MIDTGAPFYEVYETADGKWLAVGAIEARFHALLLEGLGVSGDEELSAQWDRDRWAAQKARLAGIIRSRTRDEWCSVFDGTDACVAPVLDPIEAPRHPHHQARGTFIDRNGVFEPAPAPRFSRTPTGRPGPASHAGADADAALGAWGFGPAEIDALRASGALA